MTIGSGNDQVSDKIRCSRQQNVRNANIVPQPLFCARRNSVSRQMTDDALRRFAIALEIPFAGTYGYDRGHVRRADHRQRIVECPRCLPRAVPGDENPAADLRKGPDIRDHQHWATTSDDNVLRSPHRLGPGMGINLTDDDQIGCSREDDQLRRIGAVKLMPIAVTAEGVMVLAQLLDRKSVV